MSGPERLMHDAKYAARVTLLYHDLICGAAQHHGWRPNQCSMPRKLFAMGLLDLDTSRHGGLPEVSLHAGVTRRSPSLETSVHDLCHIKYNRVPPVTLGRLS